MCTYYYSLLFFWICEDLIPKIYINILKLNLKKMYW